MAPTWLLLVGFLLECCWSHSIFCWAGERAVLSNMNSYIQRFVKCKDRWKHHDNLFWPSSTCGSWSTMYTNIYIYIYKPTYDVYIDTHICVCVCVCKNHQVPVHGALIYFIWLKSQTNLLLIFSSSLLTIFICLCWTCPSHTYLYIPVNPLCVAVPSSQRSPACPAPRSVCWGTSPNHASCPGPDNLAPQYKQLYTFLV